MTLPDGANNVYAMAGTADTTMAFPAAFQVTGPVSVFQPGNPTTAAATC